jgi:hypothetical protein
MTRRLSTDTTGFSAVEITEFRFRSVFVPVRTQIAGVAIR